MGKLSRIHDSFFKKTFSNKDNIRDFLKISLDNELYKELNLNSIDIDSSNYIDDSLKEHLSDIVIKTKLNSKDDKTSIDSDIYILFEHKSYKDKKVLFQLLKYMYLMWESDTKSNKPLRVILPLIFYNGKNKWDIKRNFSEQFQVKDAIKKYLLDYEYIFYNTRDFDFNAQKNIKIKDNVFLLSSLMLMKSAFNSDIDSIINIFSFWKEKGLINDRENLKFFFTYIVATKEVKKEKLLKILEENKLGGEEMPTLAREWIEEGKQIGLMEGMQKGMQKGIREGKQEGIQTGMQQGMQKGVQQGMIKGVQQGKTELILNMLNQGIKVEDVSKFTGLPIEEIKLITDKTN